MNLIAAVDRNWAIGNKGQLLVRIPGDHRMFRQETLDKVIVYGRKTLETFPMAQPLDRRYHRWREYLQTDASLLRHSSYHKDRLRL